MLLSARILNNVANINLFSYTDVMRFTEGDIPKIYLQLVDMGQDTALGGFSPPGKRYIPAVAATLQVTISSIDDAKKIIRFATQPYAQDPSIWCVTLFTTDVLRGSADIQLLLTEGTVITYGVVKQALAIEPRNGSRG